MTDPNKKIILPPTGIFLSETDLKRGLEVEKSKIEGLGLFATRNFKEKAVIWGETLKGKLPEEDGPLRWANHSDNPNSILVIVQGQIGEVMLVAIRNINMSEEITYNYGVFGHTGHRATCNCGETNCKGSFILRDEWGEKK